MINVKKRRQNWHINIRKRMMTMQLKTSRRTGLEKLPFFSDRTFNFLAQRAHIINAPQGTFLLDPNAYIDTICLLLSGTLKVEQRDLDGRRRARYSVCSGGGQVAKKACLIALKNCSARAVAETDVEAMLVRQQDFDMLMTLSQQFRAFVFNTCAKQIVDLLTKTDTSVPAQKHSLPIVSEIRLNQRVSHHSIGLAH
ncbi:cyclic nucleotide-binding domain-containing protein [uncultured Roseobacter sp.]|uniref:cyclic nucleotide-binding domain-containing protein n=1 Tax=uncultured Roseobacter sp. TaxID=114847 RepID=UPI00260E0B4F|nr:cyclic nucleotide-binding domain-containing protein [uncultured Roseobacter sp.]